MSRSKKTSSHMVKDIVTTLEESGYEAVPAQKKLSNAKKSRTHTSLRKLFAGVARSNSGRSILFRKDFSSAADDGGAREVFVPVSEPRVSRKAIAAIKGRTGLEFPIR